jgi:NAD(P)H-dependent FMN reductase
VIRKKVLAISGSTRQTSTNHGLIKAITDISKHDLDISLYNISNLPQFNPDNDNESVVNEVADFREQLNNADGVIICTPEYAHGVPGALKNAIDWTVSSSQFSHKPTMLITASTDGRYGHQALLETLKTIEAKNINNLQMLIQFVKTKVINDTITDEDTLKKVKILIENFIETINENKSGE